MYNLQIWIHSHRNSLKNNNINNSLIQWEWVSLLNRIILISLTRDHLSSKKCRISNKDKWEWDKCQVVIWDIRVSVVWEMILTRGFRNLELDLHRDNDFYSNLVLQVL